MSRDLFLYSIANQLNDRNTKISSTEHIQRVNFIDLNVFFLKNPNIETKNQLT